MNEFTKEELQYLIKIMFPAPIEMKMEEILFNYYLGMKIKSMIEEKEKQEKCQHEWEYHINDYFCEKCGVCR